MRKLILAGWLCLSITAILFVSCQKETQQQQDIAAGNNGKNAVTEKVNAWLDNSKSVKQPNKAANIELLKNNLDFSAMRIEKYEGDEQLITIPVKESFKTSKKIEKNAIPHLVVIVDNAGKIRKGNLVLYIPQEGQVNNKLPDNAFYEILNTGEPACSGKFLFLSVTGNKLFQFDYINGKLNSYSAVSTEKKGDNPDRITDTPLGCIDWYWVTTYYDQQGNVTSQTWQYVGTTCTNCDNPDVMGFCPDDDGGNNSGGGGGGGDLESAIAAFKATNEINSASENQGSQLVSETPEIRTKTYPWICGRALTIQARSLEYGTHKKVNNEWQWETLVHQSVNITGVLVGGSVSVTSHSGQATIGIYNAIMDVNYTLHYNAIIPGFSPINWSVTKSAASQWHVDY